MQRANESRLAAVITEGRAELANERGQTPIADERIRPELSVQIDLGQRARALLHQQRQKLKRLRRETNRFGSFEQLPLRFVEGEFGKLQFQVRLRRQETVAPFCRWSMTSLTTISNSWLRRLTRAAQSSC